MDIIGKTFGFKGIGDMTYVIIVKSFKEAGEQYDLDSYTGVMIHIYPNGAGVTEFWSCGAGYFDENVESGKYKLIG